MARRKILYVPSPTIASFLDTEREFRRIQESLGIVSDHIATEVSTEPPDNLVPFQVRYADGVSWNPRGLGAGLYILVDDVWRKFTLT